MTDKLKQAAAAKYADDRLDHWIETAKRLVEGVGANVKVAVACRALTYTAFLAGAAYRDPISRAEERARILGMLRSDEAYEFYDSKSSSAPYNGADPKDMADYLEAQLQKEGE